LEFGNSFPGNQEGSLRHIIAAQKAIAFGEALTDEFLCTIMLQRSRKCSGYGQSAFVEKGEYRIIS